MMEDLWALLNTLLKNPDDNDKAQEIVDVFEKHGYCRINGRQFLNALLHEDNLNSTSPDTWRSYLFPEYVTGDFSKPCVRAAGSLVEFLSLATASSRQGVICEFDLMFIMGCISKQGPLILETSSDAGFYFIRIASTESVSVEFLEKLCDRRSCDYYLSPVKVAAHMEMLVRNNFSNCHIKKHEAGSNNHPVTTLRFSSSSSHSERQDSNCNNGGSFSRKKRGDFMVDFAPTIATDLQTPVVSLPYVLDDGDRRSVFSQPVLLVAKSHSDPLQWRTSTSMAECHVMRVLATLSELKLSFLLQETKFVKHALFGRHSPVKSYHLKTVLLHWLAELSSFDDVRKLLTVNMDWLIFELYKRLLLYVDKGSMPHYFFRGINLLSGVELTCKAIENLRQVMSDRAVFSHIIMHNLYEHECTYVVQDDHEGDFELLEWPQLKQESADASASGECNNKHDKPFDSNCLLQKYDKENAIKFIQSVLSLFETHLSPPQEPNKTSCAENNAVATKSSSVTPNTTKLLECLQLAILFDQPRSLCEKIVSYIHETQMNVDFLPTLQSVIAVGENYAVVLIELLLQHKCVVDMAMSPQYDAIFHLTEYASRRGCLSIAEYLIAIGADVNEPSRKGSTPLTTAARGGHAAMVSLLLKYGARVDVADSHGVTALYAAAQNGHSYIIQLLVDAGADVNKALPTSGYTPLMAATRSHHLSVIEALLKNGAALTSRNYEGHTAIHLATVRNDVEIVRTLLQHYDDAPINDDLLNTAASCGSLDVAKLLIKTEGGASSINELHNGYLPLHIAVFLGDLNMVKLLVENGADVNLLLPSGASCLQLSCTHAYIDVARCLIQHGADVNWHDENHDTCFLVAIRIGGQKFKDFARMLLEECSSSSSDTSGLDGINGRLQRSPIDVNCRTSNGLTALLLSAEEGHCDMTRLLLEHGSKIDQTDAYGFTSLMLACRAGHAEVVRLLLEYGASVNHRDAEGSYTPLACAVMGGQVAAVSLLIERGADVNAPFEIEDRVILTPLSAAAAMDRSDIVRVLLENGADVGKDECADDALSRTRNTGSAEIVQMLTAKCNRSHDRRAANVSSNESTDNRQLKLRDGSRVFKNEVVVVNHDDVTDDDRLQCASFKFNEKTSEDRKSTVSIQGSIVKSSLACVNKSQAAERRSTTSLFLAEFRSDIAMATELLQSGTVNIDEKDGNGETALHKASRRGDADFVALLLSYGAAINATDHHGFTPLFMAAEHGHESIVRLLLDHGAAVNHSCNEGDNALHMAAIFNRPDVVRLLLSAGAAVDALDSDGVSPLFCAAEHGFSAVVDILLDGGANIGRKNNYGDTPLHYAAYHGQAEIAVLLVARGASVNALDNNGTRPIHKAAINGQVEVAAWLVQADRAAINVGDMYGSTPLWYASAAGHVDVVKMLLSCNADVGGRDVTGRTPLRMALCGMHTHVAEILLGVRLPVIIESTVLVGYFEFTVPAFKFRLRRQLARLN